MLLCQLGQFEPAVDSFERMLTLKPALADSHIHLASTFRGQPQLEAVAARFDRALAEACLQLGIVLREQLKIDEAERRFQQALALNPQSPQVHYNLGLIAWYHARLDESYSWYGRAIALKPDYIEALTNLAGTLREQCKLSEARAAFQRVLAVEPDSPHGQVGTAICHLIEGDYEAAWPPYEARLRLPGNPSPPDLPRWRGEPLEGRSLLVLAEQGLGDTIHFFRYCRLLKAQGARIVLAAQPALGRLLASHRDVDQFVPLQPEVELPRCDFYLPLLSAAGAFGTSLATIPSEVPYLWADPELTQRWGEELSRIDGFKIGIVWQGTRDYTADRWRSVPLARFAPLARLPGVRLISLQKGLGSEQLGTVDFPVIDFSGRLDETAGPLMDTAAVVRNLDLVVSPDTMMAHLAGALGAPVFLAVHFSNDWRWLQDRDDSPWYPSMRLFRQAAFGQWTEVFERMAEAVQRRL